MKRCGAGSSTSMHQISACWSVSCEDALFVGGRGTAKVVMSDQSQVEKGVTEEKAVARS